MISPESPRIVGVAAVDLVNRADSGTLRLDRVITIPPKDFSPGWSPLRDAAHGKPIVLTVEELLEHMVRVSDNTASDALLRLIGAPSVTTRMAELGVGGIRIDRQERQIAADLRRPGGVERYAIDARDTATPDEMLALFVAIAQRRDGLSRASHEKLIRWMIETKTGANRIKAALPRDAVIAHKTGTMPGTMNDVAIVDDRLVIVIFTKSAKSRDEDVEADIAAVARNVCRVILSREDGEGSSPLP
jgi:beta-lactamase class A